MNEYMVRAALVLSLLLLGSCGTSTDSANALRGLIEKCDVGSHASVSMTSTGLSNKVTTTCEWVVTKKSKESWSKQ